MDGKSLEVKKDKIRKLKEIFPEIFSEGKIDPETLKLTLGEELTLENERYVLNWAGKSEAFKVLQTPTTATLAPAPEESVNFDKTNNIFIEGENLEVLKVLQKAYYGKIKMIYIDPPYNTGNDNFIYPDRFSESKDEYLKRIGEKDEEGYLLKEGLFRKNNKENGHFHSNWLSMIYPRLFLARNLLREDGVIFVSIDDNEVHNLRLLMNEIFGEENFIGCFSVNTTPNARDYGHIGKMHEYCLFFSKSIDNAETYLIEDKDRSFKYKDEIGNFNVHPLYNSNEAFSKEKRPNLFYPFYLYTNKKLEEIGEAFYEIGLVKANGSIEIYPPLSIRNQIQFVWRWGKEKAKSELNKEIVGYKTEEGEYRIVQKMRTTEKLVRSIVNGAEFTSRRGTAELENIFNKKIYDYPKSVGLIKLFTKAGVNSESTILDFFSGSGTTAQAVLDLNKEDGGNRKFICVQLPEKTEEETEAFKAGYKTIADIAKERIRRAIKQISKEQGSKEIDLGFKIFKLKMSNFKIWRNDVITEESELKKQMDTFEDPVKPKAKQTNMLWEILLKTGYDLNTVVKEEKIDGVTIYKVNNGEIIVMLSEVNNRLIKEIVKQKPAKCLCLDSLFAGNDKLKTNTVLQMKDAGIDFKTI